MWEIFEHRSVTKLLASAPLEVQKKYEKWKDIAAFSGPQGLKQLKGLSDEALSGEWKGFRSSRLNLQYRVICKVDKNQLLLLVKKVTPHDYRRK